MALTRKEIAKALERMGQLARKRGTDIELSLVGGAVQSLVYRSRDSTRDVDCVILAPQKSVVRQLALVVANERDLPDDWLNDGAIGFVNKRNELKFGRIIFKRPGITVRMPKVEQLLAMKLMAWRSDIDIGDATLLLREAVREKKRGWFSRPKREKVWEAVEPYLVPGLQLKAKLAFEELWGNIYG